ncbi:hypothetical protein KAX17_17220 [Candidatus Bipolaricaulota bacterium]|nr:hypothetical protein [Candidatus Bipolaricaulota bacterium]
MYAVALFGSILLLVGTFLPWIQIGALVTNRGLDNPDGAILIGISLVAGAVALYNLVSKRNRLRWILLLAAAAAFWTGLTDLHDVQARIRNLSDTIFGDVATVGSGLYMILVGAVVLGLAGLGSYFLQGRVQNSNASDDKTQAQVG